MGKFRKSCAFLCLATFSLGLGLAGCNNKASTKDISFTVTFDSQGGSAVAAQTVKYGEKAVKPADPTKENFTFVAWYEDSVAVTEFDFSREITANWTLYAGWKVGGGGGGGDPTPAPSDDGRQDDPITTGASMQIGSRYYALEAYTETEGSPVNSWMKADFEADANEAVSFYVDGAVLSVFSDGTSTNNNITEVHPMSQPVQEVHIKTGGTMSVYLKQWSDAYTFWITTPAGGGGGGGGGQEGAIEYTCTGLPDWITNDGCVIFAWVWSPSDTGSWKACQYGSPATSLTFEVDEELTGFLLARCIGGTTTPDWNNHGDTAGRVYNQTDNIDCSAGVHSYACADWKPYN